MRRQTHIESRLAARLTRFQQAGAALPEGVVVLDEGDRIVWCNPRAEGYFGLDSQRDRGQQRRTRANVAETDTPSGQIDRAEVLALIKDQLADILEIDQATINEGDSFTEDLHLGSLELIELVEAIEEEFGDRRAGFRIEDEDLEDLKSVRDAVDYVVVRL